MKPRVIGHGDNAYQRSERVGTPAPRPMPELAWRVSRPWSLEADGFHEGERWQKWCDAMDWPSPALANDLKRQSPNEQDAMVRPVERIGFEAGGADVPGLTAEHKGAA